MRFGSLRRSAAVLLAVLAAGCGVHANTPVGYEHDPPPDPPRPVVRKAPPPPHVADDAVAQARGAVQVIRLSDGAELSGPSLGRELLEYDAICAGEAHDSAAQHYGELWLLQRLSARAENLGLELGIGFEMWAARFQMQLSFFSRGKLSEAELLSKTEYETRWGYPFAYYRPLLESARGLGVALIALNAPRELTEHIAHEGLGELPASLSHDLPELDLDDPKHRADFEKRMKHHPGLEPGDLDRYYAAQVVWDETMAQNSSRWLDYHTPSRRILIIAGQAHCQHSAIPGRIERRAARRAAAVLLATEPVPSDAHEQYDYALVVTGSAKPD